MTDLPIFVSVKCYMITMVLEHAIVLVWKQQLPGGKHAEAYQRHISKPASACLR